MPNYDIIPLAVDLLDYTIQRVKTKEPEYRKIKALVQENGQLAERELFEKIRDDGKPHFPKSQTFHLCARLEECATTILEKCISADGRYFETDFEDRLKDLDAVLVACDTMPRRTSKAVSIMYLPTKPPPMVLLSTSSSLLSVEPAIPAAIFLTLEVLLNNGCLL